MRSYKVQLDGLLEKEPTACIQAQKAAFGRLTANSGECFVLFGAGQLGRFTLAGLRKMGLEPVAFVDNDPRLWGTEVDGVQVFSAQSAAERFRTNATFIITIYNDALVREQLTKMRLRVASFATLAWQYPKVFLPYFSLEYPDKIYNQAEQVRNVLNLWADEASRQEYLGQLRWRTSLDPSVLPPHLPLIDVYFPDDVFVPLLDEVFVDCGAYNGDTVQEFVRRRQGIFGQIIAIEPDPANCHALEVRLASYSVQMRHKIHIIKSALGSRRTEVTFNATGTVGASIGEGRYKVQCAPLDELLADVNPTFIKMDIEGAEPDALLGARALIKVKTPVIAVALYHAQEHLWQLPLLIHSLCDKYDFFLRRYADECWESVCYAVPRTRLP